MFKAKVKVEVLKTILDAVSTLVDEAKIQVTPEGVSLKAVDPAHVAMVDLSIGKKAFVEYKATDMDMGVDLDKLKDILKLAASGDAIELEYKEDQHRLVFKIGHVTRRMALVDTANMGDPKVPNLNLPNQVTLLAKELKNGIRASEAVSDHIALVAHGKSFELIADGDTDQVHLSLADGDLIKIQAPDKSRSLFSLDYFSNMSKVVADGNAVTLHLGTDYPVKVEFDIADGAGHIIYLLAPASSPSKRPGFEGRTPNLITASGGSEVGGRPHALRPRPIQPARRPAPRRLLRLARRRWPAGLRRRFPGLPGRLHGSAIVQVRLRRRLGHGQRRRPTGLRFPHRHGPRRRGQDRVHPHLQRSRPVRRLAPDRHRGTRRVDRLGLAQRRLRHVRRRLVRPVRHLGPVLA